MQRKENKILHMLEGAGYEAYFVGGCVRDELIECGEKSLGADMPSERQNDIDITTNALPDEIKQVFSSWQVIETGIKHGTVTVLMPQAVCEHGGSVTDSDTSGASVIPVEITTYRSDGCYSDSRHPDKVSFVTSLKEDLRRRDFTINAIAEDARGTIVDPFYGKEDIEEKIVRAVGDADERFREDALRIMRALRFAAVLDFTIESETERALAANKYLLRNVSAERLFTELKKLLSEKNSGNVIRRYTEVLCEIIPELAAMKGFLQHNAYHKYDVLEHCIRAMEAVKTTPDNRDYMKLAALLHDIGKPRTYSMDENGVGHFYRHPHISSRIAKDILGRLKADSFTVERVGVLTKYHDIVFEKDPKLLKRWMNKFTPEILFELLEIKRADNYATGNMSNELAQKFDDIEAMMNTIISERQCFTLKGLAINGADIIALGVEPGPEVGRILEALLGAVINGEIANKHAELENTAIKMMITT